MSRLAQDDKKQNNEPSSCRQRDEDGTEASKKAGMWKVAGVTEAPSGGGDLLAELDSGDIDRLIAPILGPRYPLSGRDLYDARTKIRPYDGLGKALREAACHHGWALAVAHVRYHWAALFVIHDAGDKFRVVILDSAPSQPNRRDFIKVTRELGFTETPDVRTCIRQPRESNDCGLHVVAWALVQRRQSDADVKARPFLGFDTPDAPVVSLAEWRAHIKVARKGNWNEAAVAAAVAALPQAFPRPSAVRGRRSDPYLPVGGAATPQVRDGLDDIVGFAQQGALISDTVVDEVVQAEQRRYTEGVAFVAGASVELVARGLRTPDGISGFRRVKTVPRLVSVIHVVDHFVAAEATTADDIVTVRFADSLDNYRSATRELKLQAFARIAAAAMELSSWNVVMVQVQVARQVEHECGFRAAVTALERLTRSQPVFSRETLREDAKAGRRPAARWPHEVSPTQPESTAMPEHGSSPTEAVPTGRRAKLVRFDNTMIRPQIYSARERPFCVAVATGGSRAGNGARCGARAEPGFDRCIHHLFPASTSSNTCQRCGVSAAHGHQLCGQHVKDAAKRAGVRMPVPAFVTVKAEGVDVEAETAQAVAMQAERASRAEQPRPPQPETIPTT